jgi:hypothetical protein
MRKNKRIGLWLTDEEKILVARLAEIEGGLSRAALIRRLIHQSAKEHNLIEPETLVNINKPRPL